MSIRAFTPTLLSVATFTALLLGACDPKGAAGAIGAEPRGGSGVAPEASPSEAGQVQYPGPGGVTPTIDPSVDPLRDPLPDQPLPLPAPRGGRGGVDGGGDVKPLAPLDPAAKGGCRCHLQCGPRNDDGSKDCITICEGSGCD